MTNFEDINLPSFFVQWLWITETGWREDCKDYIYGQAEEDDFIIKDICKNFDEYDCDGCVDNKVLTPLGKLMNGLTVGDIN